MSKKFSCSVAAFLACGMAWAQQPAAGTATQVEGLVTISDGTNVSTLHSGRPIPDGARLVTSSSGSARLEFGSNCAIPLRPNQSLTVQRGAACSDLISAIQTLGSDHAALLTSGGADPNVVGLFVAGGAIAGIATANRGGPGSGSVGGGGGGIPNPPISGQ